MATVLDALIISLNLDASGFSRSATKTRTDLKQIGVAGDATAKDIGNAAKQMAASINRVRTEVLALFTAFTAGRGIKQLVGGIVDGDAATGRLARSVGMATGEIATLQEAAKRVGGTAEGVGASIAGLSAKFTEFRETGQGGESWIPVLQRMGIALVDDTGKIKSFTQLFSDLAGWSEKKTPQQSGYWLSQLGLDPGTIRLVQEGRAGMQRSLAEARSLGVASDKDAANAQELLANIANIHQAIDGVVRVIVNEFAPVLNEALRHFTAWLVENGPRLRIEIGDRVAEIVKEVRSFISSADNAADTVGRWIKVSEGLFALWTASKVAGLIGAVAKVGGLFGGGAGGLGVLGPAGAVAAVMAPSATNAGETDAVRKLHEDEARDPAAFARRGRDTSLEAMNGPGASRRDQDDFIDRFARSLSRFLGHDTTMDTGTGDAGVTPGEAARAGRSQLGASAPALGNAEQQARAKQAYDFFVAQGNTPELAAGLTARMKLESGFNPGAVGDNGTAYGTMQWHKDRRDRLAKAGINVIGGSFEDHLRAWQWELTHSEKAAGDAGNQAPTATAAGRVVSRQLVRPGLTEDAKAREAERTGLLAEDYYRMFHGAGGQRNAAPSPAVQPQKISALRWGNTTNNSTADNSSTTSNHIGQVVVNTQARNGREVAGSIKNYLADMTYTDSRRALS